MKRLAPLLFLILSVNSGAAETIHTEYSNKLQALKSLEGTVQKAANPTDTIVFPQVANGASQGIRIITSIILTNVTSDPISVALAFRTEFGSPMALSLFDSNTGSFVGFNSAFNIQIFGFQSTFLETDGFGGLVEGWASAETLTPESMGGVAAFQLILEASNQFLTIVGVGGSDSTIAFSLPVFKDASLNSNTALALANSSNATVRLQVFLFGNNGTADTTFITIAPFRHLSMFVDEIFSSVGNRFFGTIHFFRVDNAGEVQFSFDTHPVGLFLSNGILTSIPVTNLVAF